MVANHVVDEARMSPHFFKEQPKLTNHLDLTVVDTDTEFLEYYLF